MPIDRFMIGPMDGSLQTDLKPWAITDNSFAQLENAYVFRGRVRKRFGSILMGNDQKLSRLRVQVGTYGAQTSPVPGTVFKIGQSFSILNDIFTIYQNGALLSTNANASGTFNTATGAWSITYSAGAPPGGTPVYWYPGEPVMGLTNYEKGPINNQPSYAFDTQFAYKWNNGWARSGTLLFLLPGNLNYVWTCNWEGLTPDVVTMFATNFQVTNSDGAWTATDDPIWYTSDGSTWTALNAQAGANGFYFLPTGQARYQGPYVQTAKIIVSFKNRLLLLNTIENNNPNHNGLNGTNTAYPNRCRFSINGSPFAQNAWYEPNTSDTSGTAGGLSIAAGAGWIDATTEEQIVSAEFIKDRLIVYFERSTWELAYTGNEKQPFIWQKLNTELGADSTFSVVPFDKEILCISNVGVHACNGSNVVRIDNKIPDQIFKIKNKNSNTERVAGVRDYFVEQVYWTFPESNTNFTYNNKILVYNYRNGSWSINDDCFTVWGNFEQQTDVTWATTSLTWEEFINSWDSGVIAAQFRQIIAGNQEGWVLIIAPDVARNAPSMQLTNVVTASNPSYLELTIVDNTLAVYNPFNGSGDVIGIENALGVTNLNGLYPIAFDGRDLGSPDKVWIVKPATFSGTYTGGGTINRVSNPQILTKQFNPYDKEGRNVYISKVDFLVDKTDDGAITIDYSVSSSNQLTIQNSEPDVVLDAGILTTAPYALFPFEQTQTRLWHPLYFNAEGECIQLFFYLNDTQIVNPAIAYSDFQLHAFILHSQRTSSRLQ